MEEESWRKKKEEQLSDLNRMTDKTDLSKKLFVWLGRHKWYTPSLPTHARAAADLLISCGLRAMEARWVPGFLGGRSPFVGVFPECSYSLCPALGDKAVCSLEVE